MKVAMIDFDGTITLKNDFPNIGELRPGALEGIKALQENGWTCCLWTCRHGEYLEMAKNFLESHGVVMDGYNTSPYDGRFPGARKPIADIYIDDSAFPVKLNKDMLDWNLIVKCLTS